MSAPVSTHHPDLGHVSNAPEIPDPTQANAAPRNLIMQEDMSRSQSLERQSGKSSAQMSAESRSVDARKPLLTAGGNNTGAYLARRLGELKVRKIDKERAILDQQKANIDSLMKDLDDFKIRVQNDDHVGAARQHLLEECATFQRELQQSWHTLLTKEQEYSTAMKKQKISDPHDTKAAPSRDQVVHPRPGQAASVIPVTSLQAHGHVQALIEGIPDKACDPIINSPVPDTIVKQTHSRESGQGLQTSSWEECKNADGVTVNARQEWVTNTDAGRKQSQQASNAQGTAVRVQAGSTQGEAIRAHANTDTQEEVSRDRANIYTQGEVSRGHANIYTQEEISRGHASIYTQGEVSRGHANIYTQGEPSRDCANIYTQGEASRGHANIYTQGEASRGHANSFTQYEASKPHDQAITNSQQTVRTFPDAHVPNSQSTTGRAEAATSGTATNAGADGTASDCFQGPVNNTGLPAKAEQSSIDLLLIGNCGNGKSATGNSILGKPAFRTSASSSVASASSIKMDSTDFAGRVVNVIDGPSINVSGNITPEEVGNIIEKISQSLELCNCAFTALVIILKFGIRYTNQEIEALRVIKAALGKDVIREYGVCVITHGDNFDYSIEEARQDGEEMTFDSWLKEQTGVVTTLFKECNFRCVLFDNVTKDVTKRQAQLDKLMEILPKGKSYSKDAFFQARHGTEELEMEASLPTFLKAAKAEADNIKELINQHEEIKEHDPEASYIKQKLRQLKEKVHNMRVSSGELENLKMFLQLLESNLHSKLTKWQRERDIMKLGAQGTTSARSSTPSLADQTTMAIHNTPYGSFGTDSYRDMSAPSNFNSDISAPSEFATSKNETSSCVDKGSHAVSYTVSRQSWFLNEHPTTATRQMYETRITDQHPGPPEKLASFVVVDKEMVSPGGNASYAYIIEKRLKNACTLS